MYDEDIPVHAMKGYGGVEIESHPFLVLAIDGDARSGSHLNRFTPAKELTVPTG